MAGSRGLGTLTIDLALRTGMFTAPLDKAERELSTRTKRMNKMANAFGKTLGIGIGVGFTAVAAGMGVYIKNTIEAEKVQAQLGARIKDTFGIAGRSIQQLNATADKLQGLTVFDDEAIGGVQAMLLTFKEIRGIEFDKATAAVLDLSTAMGTDLNSAALQLGKALNDPIGGIGALSRAGVQFSKDQKAVIKALVETGDTAGAQEIILRELEGQMGTAAEAARNTLGGALQGLKNDFDNLLEGDSGSEGVRGTVAAINSLDKTINDPGLKAGIDSLASGLLSAAGGAVEAAAEVGNLISKYREWLDQQGFMATSDSGLGARKKRLQERIASLQNVTGASGMRFEPVGSLTQRGASGQIALLKKELDKVNAELAASGVNRAFDAVRSVTSSGKPAPPSGSATSKKTGSGRAKSSMPDFMGADLEDLRRMVEQTTQANEELDRMAATLSGPLAAAEYEHQQNLKNITDLGKEAGRSASELNDLREMETKRYAEQRTEIEKTLDPLGALLDSMGFEADLIGKSNAERQVMNLLRSQGIGLMSEEAKGALAIANAYENQATANGNQIELMDSVRDSAKGFLGDLSHGVSLWDSMSNALDKFADKLFDLASSNVIDQLFGKQGSSGGGSAGGWLSSLIGAFTGGSGVTQFSSNGVSGSEFISAFEDVFAGGFAKGGFVPANSWAEVNERGLEMATVGGRDYMLTGNQPVHVTPNHQLGGQGGGMTVVQNFPNARLYDRRSDTQRMSEAAMKLRTGTRFA